MTVADFIRPVLYATILLLLPVTFLMAVSTKKKKYETLADFGYFFNEDGELRDKETNEGFNFNVYESHSENQKRYEKFGEVMQRHVYRLLEEDAKLHRVDIPIEEDSKEAGKGFIFQSEDAFTNDKLILIIHGGGAVRAGQWSRRLIINHSLESGSQLPYIKKAMELGFGVLVLNYNQRYDEENGEGISCNETPEKHFSYVWETFVMKSAAKDVAIVAHSYGGVVTTNGAALHPSVIDKTFAVAFTDSVHYGVKTEHRSSYNLWMENNVRNWASSSKDLDQPIHERPGDCPTVSAGTKVHEETSWKAFDSVWSFIMEKWSNLKKKEEQEEKEAAAKLLETTEEKESDMETTKEKESDMETTEEKESDMVKDTSQQEQLHSDL